MILMLKTLKRLLELDKVDIEATFLEEEKAIEENLAEIVKLNAQITELNTRNAELDAEIIKKLEFLVAQI